MDALCSISTRAMMIEDFQLFHSETWCGFDNFKMIIQAHRLEKGSVLKRH
jgi:hypothetical protein